MGNKCCICGAQTAMHYHLYDDRYGYPGIFSLLKCDDCGHNFLHGSMSPEQLADLYTNYYPRSSFSTENYKPAGEMTGFRAWFTGARQSAFRWVPRNVRVLDVGCGFGESLGYHRSRGCDVYGVEADENIRRVAEKFGFKVHVGLFDSKNYEPDFFDYVTMDQVIEHVTDPISTMKGIAKILKRGGTAIVSTPNAIGWGSRLFGRHWINWHAPYHLQFFSPASMAIAAEQAGMVIDRVKTITSSEWLFYQWIHLLTRPPMGKPSAFWSPRAARGIGVKFIFAVLLAFHYTKIDHVITRLFDALGIGDNYLFILRKT
jgi:2-polyprenyl-3-methyl-5-hydroxy-6-metoxy-1,4-benzoquinol methylase